MTLNKPVARDSGEAYQIKNDLNTVVQDWALKNADKLKRSCSSCVYARKEGSFICSKYSLVPPLNVIMNGCEGYSDCDDIPF